MQIYPWNKFWIKLACVSVSALIKLNRVLNNIELNLKFSSLIDSEICSINQVKK